MPTKKQSAPRFNVNRTPRTDDEKGLLRELKTLRDVDGIYYTGSRIKDGQTRYVIQVDEATARKLLAVLSPPKAKSDGTTKARTRKTASGQISAPEGVEAPTAPAGKIVAKKSAARTKAAAK